MKIILLVIAYALIFTVYSQDKYLGMRVNNDDVNLSWNKIANNISYFEVERKSAQVDDWKIIQRIYAENRIHFIFTDNDLPPETFYYRVKAVGKDGTLKYSSQTAADLNIPFRFSLDQNYPNPFNPETVIKYSIPEAGNVDLRIFNLLGQEVAKLVSVYQEAGEHTVHFDASELNSGLYIYKLISGDQVLTRKMTLIK